MQSTVLAISDRLEDLRRERGLTLEELAEATKISKSALSKYENMDFKDISPFNVATLAKFYGVTTDYLLGVSNIENRSDVEIHELCLTNDALRALKSGKINGKLLSDVICHKDFQKNVRSVIEAKGSHEEQAATAYLSTFGIDYDSLTPEEFVVLIGILKKSKLAKNGISRRGKTPSTLQKKRKK